MKPDSAWRVVATAGGPKDYWRLLTEGKEGDALAVYRANIPSHTDMGGMRLLNPEGKCVRFAGPLGKPGSEE